MPINITNNRNSTTGMKRFSKCCSKPVGNKYYCKGCNEDVLYCDIQKGFSEENILTEKQTEKMKEFLEGGNMDILSIQDITETTTYDILPYIQKTQIIFPSISKDYRKKDLRTYYSFVNVLKKENKYCIVKYTTRSVEHLGILIHHKGDLLFFEICFNHYQNTEETDRIKEGIKNTIRIDKVDNLYGFEKEAKKFIKSFESKIEVCDVKEEKLKLINEFKDMDKTIEVDVGTLEKEENPFLTN